MKIGVITYHRSHNYGALLQAFALINYLKLLGHSAEIIDYWPSYHSKAYRLFGNFKNLSLFSKLKQIIIFFLYFGKINKRRKGYINFYKDNFFLKTKPKHKTPLTFNEESYDLIIYGSDQIWRKQTKLGHNGFDNVYFGEFPDIDVKKITYAASMGNIDLNEEDLQVISKNLKNFDSISLRENELLQALAGLNSNFEIVLDPVFLLSKEDWLKHLPERKVKNKYVFLYKLLNSNESVLLCEEISKENNYEIIEIPGTNVNHKLKGERYQQTSSPLEFLSLIYYADYVISTSFHGVAFSIIFEKQFYATGMGNNSGRVGSLLESLQIKGRYIDSLNQYEKIEDIDYEIVNDLLLIQKNKSKKFLSNAISKIHE